MLKFLNLVLFNLNVEVFESSSSRVLFNFFGSSRVRVELCLIFLVRVEFESSKTRSSSEYSSSTRYSTEL